MQFTHGVGLVTGAAKRVRQRGQRGHGLLRFEDAVAVRLGRRACHERSPCGDAYRTFAVGVAEARAAASQLV